MRYVKFNNRWCYISEWFWSIRDGICRPLVKKKVILDSVKRHLHFHTCHPLLQILWCFLYALISVLRHKKEYSGTLGLWKQTYSFISSHESYIRKNFLKARLCWISASRKPVRQLVQHWTFLECCFHTALSLRYMTLRVLLSQMRTARIVDFLKMLICISLRETLV